MRYVMLGVQIKGDGRGEEMISNSVLSLGFDDGSFYLLFSKSDGIFLMRNRGYQAIEPQGEPCKWNRLNADQRPICAGYGQIT